MGPFPSSLCDRRAIARIDRAPRGARNEDPRARVVDKRRRQLSGRANWTRPLSLSIGTRSAPAPSSSRPCRAKCAIAVVTPLNARTSSFGGLDEEGRCENPEHLGTWHSVAHVLTNDGAQALRPLCNDANVRFTIRLDTDELQAKIHDAISPVSQQKLAQRMRRCPSPRAPTPRRRPS